MNVIECNNVVKRYRRTDVLTGMSFTIRENRLTGLIGRNGAGKTTLLKIIAGFVRPTEGEVNVFSENPFNSLFVSANSILIDETTSFPPSLNLADILDEVERFYANWDRELAQRLFQYFSLDPRQVYRHLSKGMRSTFNMIIGICARCALTLFDEPMTGMDEATRKDFYRVLLKDYIAFPRTIIISSHHLQEIDRLLEDVLLMKDGQVHFHLPIADLKEWAIGIHGQRSIVEKWVKGKEIIHKQENDLGHTYVVVKNDPTDPEDVKDAQRAGLNIKPISVSDLCMYVTNQHKGGIDDVFDRTESF